MEKYEKFHEAHFALFFLFFSKFRDISVSGNAYSVHSRYLNQCWLNIDKILTNMSKCISKRNCLDIIHKNSFEIWIVNP